MSIKKISFKKRSRFILFNGMYLLTKCVSITLGPLGQNVVLMKPFGIPKIINDGVTIAKEINLKKDRENTGTNLLRQVALKINKMTGDGTSTAIIFAYTIMKQSLMELELGSNPIDLVKGFQIAKNILINKLFNFSKSIENFKEISQVSLIASGGDKEITKLINNAIRIVGKGGNLFVEESNTITNEIDIIEGLHFSQGFISYYFVTDKERLEAILKNAYVLLTDKKIISVKNQLTPIIKLIKKKKKSLLIISDELETKALSTLVKNKLKGIINVMAVELPSFGNCRKDFLADLAILTEAKIISANIGKKLKHIHIADLGWARRVVIKKKSTIVISDINKNNVILRRKRLIHQSLFTESEYKKELLLERIANLNRKTALIKTGGLTETELKDHSLRLEDAVNATKAAIEEGIIPGGGVTLLRMSKLLIDCASKITFATPIENSLDVVRGILIIRNSLEFPVRTIISNSGKNADTILQSIQASNHGIGYDIAKKELVDMFITGIIDPLKVTRLIIENAISIAGTFLKTECMVVVNSKIFRVLEFKSLTFFQNF